LDKLEPTTLRGKYVELLPLNRSHHAQLCEIGLDDELWRFTTNQITTPQEMSEYIEAAIADHTSGTGLPFVIVEKAHGKIVGSTRYHSHSTANRRVVIGHTWIARDWQRTFVNTETKYLMLKHAFEELNCIRVEFIVNSINERSHRALLRIGAKQDGLLRSYVVGKDNAICDVAVFSIVDTEWTQVKASLEAKLKGALEGSTATTQSSYDKVAVEYAQEFRDELSRKPFDRKMLDWLIEKVARLGPICDLGCGPGQVAAYVHERGAEAMGIDLSNEMIRQAQLLNPQIRFEQGNILELTNIADASLGGVAAFYSLLHLPRASVVKGLSEINRVLRSGGVLLTANHIGADAVHRDEWFGQEVSLDFLFFETSEMKDYVVRAGFTLEEVLEREPYVGSEYPSRRAYIFARKQ
jgi:RimJ/RimL family protein N-acetyltransferase/SAM-dependent methyltransferase